jgi:hypothetical protein
MIYVRHPLVLSRWEVEKNTLLWGKENDPCGGTFRQGCFDQCMTCAISAIEPLVLEIQSLRMEQHVCTKEKI